MRSRLAVCVLGFAVVASANPYHTISERNSFKLKPRQQDVSKPGDVFKPPADIKLTGIAAFGAHKWVLLTKADAGKPARYFMMREGESADGLEVIAVDEMRTLAEILYDGARLELSLATNTVPRIDVATQRFVNDHTRAHELHQRREAARIAHERAELERTQRIQGALETQPDSVAAEQGAVLESQ